MIANIQTVFIDARSVSKTTSVLLQDLIKNAIVQISDHAPILTSDMLIVTACKDMTDHYRTLGAKVCRVSTADKGMTQTADISRVIGFIYTSKEKSMPKISASANASEIYAPINEARARQ